MEQMIYSITAIIYAIFIVRFILSWIGGDFDLDMDADGDVDVGLGDVISFKGITHFLMGFFGWLSTKLFITHIIEWYDYIIAFALGLVFFIILIYVYKFMMKLEYKPVILKGKQLVGKSAKIYLQCTKKDNEPYKYIITIDNGIGTIEVPACSIHNYDVGDMVTVTDYENSYYVLL